MQNKYLRRVRKALPSYFCYFKADNILVLSEDKSVLPFAYLIHDPIANPNFLLLSLAVDYPHSERAVEVALIANTVLRVALTENFFVSQTGNTYIGQEAFKHYEIECELPLQDIEPSSKTQH